MLGLSILPVYLKTPIPSFLLSTHPSYYDEPASLRLAQGIQIESYIQTIGIPVHNLRPKNYIETTERKKTGDSKELLHLLCIVLDIKLATVTLSSISRDYRLQTRTVAFPNCMV
jgi:hypothetical protein